MKVKEDVIAELHGNLLKKDEEIASLKSLLDEQKNKNNVSQPILPFKEAVLQNSNKLAVYSGRQTAVRQEVLSFHCQLFKKNTKNWCINGVDNVDWPPYRDSKS